LVEVPGAKPVPVSPIAALSISVVGAQLPSGARQSKSPLTLPPSVAQPAMLAARPTSAIALK